MSQAQLRVIATRHQVYLERLKSQYAFDFQGAFDALQRKVKKTLRNLEVDNLSDLTKANLQATLRNLQNAQGEIFSEHIDKLQTQLKQLNDYETGFEARSLKSVAAKDQKPLITRADPVKAWQRARLDPIHATGELLEPFIDRVTSGTTDTLNNAILTAYDQGLTVPETISKLFGTAQNRYLDGVTAISRRQASTVVRTAVQHVANTAREATWNENDDLVKGVIWVSTLDSRTTIQCQCLDGQRFDLDSGPRPPIHPNCRSTTAPWMDDSFDFLDKGATRSSAGGYVDQKQTYYDWLGDQPDSFQDDALGPERAQLFRDGGLSAKQFADLNLGRNFQPLTLDQMRTKEPQAFAKAGL